MSFSSGTYTLPAAYNPVVSGNTITSTWANTTLDDIATALSTCVLKDGTQTTTASVPFAQGISVTTAMTTPSTTFALVNTTATTLNFAGAATTLNIGAATSDTTWTGQSFTLTGANSTDNTVLAVTNTSNAAAASHSYVDVSVGGTTSTGDPHLRLTIPSGTSWYVGVDNSDSDLLKVGTGTAVGTNGVLTLSSTVLSPSTTDGVALGSTSLMWADGFFASGAVLNFNAGNYTITHSAGLLTFSNAITITTGTLTATAGIISFGGAATDYRIGPTTSDASDNARVFLSGGGAYGDVSRGAYIEVAGNEHADTGALLLVAGNVVGGVIDIYTGATRQVQIIRTTSADRYLTLSGSAGGNPTIATSAGSLAITPAVVMASTLTVDTILSAATTATVFNTVATTVNAFGAATTLAIGAAASATTWTGQSFSLTGANSTNNTALTVQNTSNAAAASHAYIDVAVGGITSTGDPHIRFTIPSGTAYYIGPDNSDSDILKIGTGTAVGTNVVCRISSTIFAIANAQYYGGRNAADNNQISLIGVTAADAVQITPGGQTTLIGGILEVTGEDITGSAAGTLRMSEGARIGADSTNNLLDDASTGAGTATLYIGNASINVTSDERVKIGVREWRGDAAALLRSLPVKEWEAYSSHAPMGGYSGKYVGFTAQDIHAIAPWAVNTQGDTGLPWQARYEFLNGLIVKGWQEHEERLRKLESR